MKGKTHPLSIIFGIILIVLGVFAMQVAFLRIETIIHDFSYILLNVFFVLFVFGLTFIWVGLAKFQSISFVENTLVKKYCFGLIKKNYYLTEESYYSIYVTDYFLFKNKVIIIENQAHQQIYFSSLNILNFNQIQNYIKDKLAKEEIKFRINQSDEVLIYSQFTLFLWLIISSLFNLTF